VVRQDREECASVCACKSVSGLWCVCRCVKKHKKYSGQIIKKVIITLQILSLKLKSLLQTCILSIFIMQLPKKDFFDFAIFVEKKKGGKLAVAIY
jgi:hypothetical protein